MFCWWHENAYPADARQVNLDMMWSREPDTVLSAMGTVVSSKGKLIAGDGTYTPWFGTWHVEDTCGFPSSGLHMRLDRMSPRILNLILSGNCARSIIRSMSLHNMALRSDRGQTLGSTNCFCYARESLWKNDGQISDSGHRSFIGYYVGIAQGIREDIDEWRGV